MYWCCFSLALPFFLNAINIKVVDYCEGSYLEPGANKREVSTEMPQRVSMRIMTIQRSARWIRQGGGRRKDYLC